MRYVIHSAPVRQWYVDDFLISEMLKQGIPKEEIVVRCDSEGKGNLFACMESFWWCGQNPADGSWHLQDDIALCRDFAKRTREIKEEVVCGITIADWGPDYTKFGLQPVKELWYSFQCIKIPDALAGQCAKWFFEEAYYSSDPEYKSRIKRKKHDDDFFRFFLLKKYPALKILNLKPNLVDHIDYMLGGSLINSDREKKINRARWWDDEELVENLELKIEQYRKEKGE